MQAGGGGRRGLARGARELAMVGVVLVHDMEEEEEEEKKLRRQGAADVQLSVDVDHRYVTLAHGPEGVGGGEQFFWGKNWRISKVLLLLFALAWVAALVFKVGVMRRSVIDKEAVDFTALVSSSSSVAVALLMSTRSRRIIRRRRVCYRIPQGGQRST